MYENHYDNVIVVRPLYCTPAYSTTRPRPRPRVARITAVAT